MVKLYNGDCLEVMDKLIVEGVKVDAIITDPPYLMNYRSNRRKVKDKFDYIANDKDSNSVISDSFKSIDNLLNDGSPVFIFCSWHKIDFFKKEFEKYWKLKNIIVWVKNNHGTGDLSGAYAPKHELILFGEKKRCKRNDNRKRVPDVFFFDKVPSNKLYHPTEKPIKLIEEILLDYMPEDAIVLDSFMGSASTGVACVNTNRKFIGIELDEKYFNIAKERIGGVVNATN